MAHHKHVMCEKSAGGYTKQVREMNEAAAKSDVVLMMFNQRTNNLYKKMHEIVSSGELGASASTGSLPIGTARKLHDSAPGAPPGRKVAACC